MFTQHACATPRPSSHPAARLRSHTAILIGLALASGHAGASEPSGNATATTDYVWRGTTQSQGDPALQAGLKLAGARGVYASAWASSVAFPTDPKASTELDLVVGWSGALSPQWSLDVNLTHYRYPAATSDLDWTELVGTLTWKQDRWLQLGHSRHALAGDRPGTYAQLGARWPWGERLRVEAVAGRYWFDGVDGDGRTHAGYAHAQLGAVWAIAAPLELRVTVHTTDNAAKRLFPGLAGTRIEGALQASF